MWKPGQIVTIKDKRYRITHGSGECLLCDHIDTPVPLEPCRTCLFGLLMPDNCHLQEIKPKSVMG